MGQTFGKMVHRHGYKWNSEVVFMMLCNEALTYCTCISHCVDFADLTFIMSVL